MADSGAPDAASPAQLPDAGNTDAGIDEPNTGDCDTVSPLRIPLSEATQLATLTNTASSPDDFEIGRVEHIFADCTRRTLELRLGNGRCTRPRSPELRLEFAASEIEAGRIRQGQIEVRSDRSPASAGLSVRFRRTDGSNAGEWGSCGIPTGTLDLRTTPRLERGSTYAGSFDLGLPPCDGTDAEPVIVQGTFNLSLSVSLETACGL